MHDKERYEDMKEMMMKRFFTAAMAVAVMITAAGCAKNLNININNVPSDAADSIDTADSTDAEEVQESQEPSSDTEEYESSNGWSVKYDPSLFSVNEAENMTSFVYTGESAGTNMLTISYIKDKQPEEVLSELTDGWGDSDDIVKGESYFPGTVDRWGCWRSLVDNGEGSGLSENVFAGEYNGGVLMFEFTTHKAGDDNIDRPVSSALSAISDSITYDDFEPQKMYEDYPGVYKLSETEEIEGEEVTYEYSVTLNEDHSGVISMQDDLYVMWGSDILIQADNSYDYTLEGDSLILDMDGIMLTFTREGTETDGEETGVLPAYKYPGDDRLMAAVYEYIVDKYSTQYDKADVSIPAVTIVDTDDSDPDDIRVWGDFRIDNYDLEGDTLMAQSGGSYPGCIHLRKTGDDYEVTEVEEVEDGSGYTSSAKKIFGSRFEAFIKSMDDEKREEIRTQIIADYVKANGLSVKKYQDYGWDPVQLPL